MAVLGRTYGWSDTLGREDWSAPRQLGAMTVDSLLGVFREIDRETSAVLHTVQLGAFRERGKADALYRHLDDLRPADDRDLRDTTMAVDWWQSTCASTARPNLFVVVPDTTTGLWRVNFGLFVDRGDAVRAARSLRLDHRVIGVVRALPLGRDLVQATITQWRVRGVTDSD